MDSSILHRVLTAFGVAALGGAALAADYKFTDLGALGSRYSQGLAINAAGQIAGNAEMPDWSTHAVLWKGKTPIDLGADGVTSFARGVNDHGVIVGETYLPLSTDTRPTRWHRGEVTDLGTLGGPFGGARAINRCGHIVGWSQLLDGGSGHATLWADEAIIDLGGLGSGNSFASAINAVGQMAGSSQTPDKLTVHAVLWTQGRVVDLGSLGGRNKKYSFARSINDAGDVVGVSRAEAGADHATLWRDGAAIDLGTLGGRDSAAYGINNAGQIVGFSDPPLHKTSRHLRAVMWQDGQMIDLNTLLDKDSRKSGWVLSHAYAINDQGTITGIASNKRIVATDHAFRLEPRDPPPFKVDAPCGLAR